MKSVDPVPIATADRPPLARYVYSFASFPSFSFSIFLNNNPQDATFHDLFISTDAVHVSGGSPAHNQEHTTVHTASGIVNRILLLAASVDEIVRY